VPAIFTTQLTAIATVLLAVSAILRWSSQS
jgi:hypothetical protein